MCTFLFQCIVQLTNAGPLPLQNLQIKLSHPSLTAFALETESDSSCDAPPSAARCLHLDLRSGLVDLSLLPSTLQPAQSWRLALFVRGAAVGRCTVSIMMRYDAPGPVRFMCFRSLSCMYVSSTDCECVCVCVCVCMCGWVGGRCAHVE